MSNKVTLFTLALILFAAIVLSSVEAHECPYSKRSNVPLNKRNETKPEKCPCSLGQAIFEKNVTGISVFAQNECGVTSITGFLTGLKEPSKNVYNFFITDRCGKIITNLTDVLNAKISADGVTQFTAKDKDLNLDCDKDGIFNLFCKDEKCEKKVYKRDGQGADMLITQNNGPYARANLNKF
ncbi:2883_t:CDS:1 [Acaulospora morrowiae]|uniref:2883_t:CDS:1 n=1 Tax=Acaulospora morrowiae TaxID=94023 RepID=A0A9N9IE02_9GLOM|nr:2883_t:CDS:1 [Acaulospora morrowiae]